MNRTSKLRAIFPEVSLILGMAHPPPLPGAPGWEGSMEEVLKQARGAARTLVAGGVDGVMVENYQHVPFYPRRVPAETVAAMAVVVLAVVEEVDVPVGVNVLRNDGLAALGVAAATGARMVRINVHSGAMLGDQGWLEGEAHETMRLRQRLGLEVAVLADVLVKHATAPAGLDLAQAARDAWDRGLADALIVSGVATGAATDPTRLKLVKAAVPGAPVLVGSGANPENAADLLDVADGAIVGSAFMAGGVAGAGVVPSRVASFMKVVRR